MDPKYHYHVTAGFRDLNLPTEAITEICDAVRAWFQRQTNDPQPGSETVLTMKLQLKDRPVQIMGYVFKEAVLQKDGTWGLPGDVCLALVSELDTRSLYGQ